MQDDTIDGYTEGEEPLVFHYSREERLKKAPQNVRDYYEGKMNVKRGLLKSLIATKANQYMLFSIALCMTAIFMVSKFGADSEKNSIGGTNIELSAFSFEDKIYVSTKLEASAAISNKDDVSENIIAMDKDRNEISTSICADFYDGKKLVLRTTFSDNNIEYIKAEVEIYGKTKELFAKVKR